VRLLSFSSPDPRRLAFVDIVTDPRPSHRLRILYESYLIASGDESAHDAEHGYITPDVVRYFEHEAAPEQRVQRQITKERAIRGEGQPQEKVYRSKLEESLVI
jgi:hypothetical protein